MDLSEAVKTLEASLAEIKSQTSAWSIVVLDRGWVLVGKLTYTDSGEGVLTQGAVIRRWGTTKGLPELQAGPTEETVFDVASMPIRFKNAILTLDAHEEWENAY